MPGIYKLFTAVVALIGNISLISTGEMNPVFSIIGTGLFWGYYRALRRYPSLPKWAVGTLTSTTFIIFLVNLYISRDIFISVAQMTLIFQTIKSFDIKDPWDPLQVFFMSLLQLLMASELTNTIYFGIVFVVFVIFFVISIVLGHFVKEGQGTFRPYQKPIVLITIITIILTIAFFVSLPRFRSSLWGKSFSKGIKTAGFSEKVDFGSFEELKLDETVVMRILLTPEERGPHYLRGMTFDYFDTSAWYDTLKHTRKLFRTSDDFNIDVPAGAKKYEAEIYLEPIDTDVIFTFKTPYKIDAPGFFMRGDNAGSFYMKQKASKRFSYKLYSIDSYYYDNMDIDSYLQFSDNIPSVKKLAEGITAISADNLRKAEKIKDYLISNYTYSLSAGRPSDGSNAIEYFLLKSKRGYCEHFATTMVLMLRSINIPARLVTGFLSGQRNDVGNYYFVRQSDAHSWVEAFIDGRWMLFDPTPQADISRKSTLLLFLDMMRLNWNRYVVGFSSYDQKQAANYLFDFSKMKIKLPGIPYVKIAFAVIAIFILYFIYKSRRNGYVHSKYEGISAEYVGLRKIVSRYGGRITPSSTTDDVLREAVNVGRFNTEEVKRFIEHYRFLRFSGRSDKDLLRDFLRSAKALKKTE
jgi:transglutaminase-like putative cysteine protease